MAALGDIASSVRVRLDGFLLAERARWEAEQGGLREPIDALRKLVLSGGKCLRPAFCHWAFVGAGGDPADPIAIDAGAALEMLHAAALVHDDVMDDADLRRGLRTVHVDFAHRHVAHGWRGEHRRFGDGVAILVGDLAFVYADVLLARAPRQCHLIFDEMRVELCMGQFVDVCGTAEQSRDYEMSRWIASYKSGKYTVERPLHLGAALAGRLDGLADHLSSFGLPLGEAFQLKDDLLGVFGDERVTGKPVGADLCEGKPTLLLAIASKRAGAAGRAMLRRAGAVDLSDDEIKALQSVIIETGARDEVEASIERLVARALAGLDRAPLTAESRDALSSLAAFVTRRDH